MGSDSHLVSLVTAIKSWGPAPDRLRVTTLDGDTAVVAVSKARNKWARLSQTIGQLDWARVEGLNAKDQLLGMFEHPDLEAVVHGAATELEDLATDKQSASVFAMVGLMERAMGNAVLRVGEHHVKVLDAAIRMLDMATARLVQSEQQSAQHAETIQALLTQAQGDGDGDGATGEVVQMVTKLLTTPGAPKTKAG